MMNRADRIKLMAATLRTSNVWRKITKLGSPYGTIGTYNNGKESGCFLPLTDVEAIDLAFTYDSKVDARIKAENMKGLL